MSGPADVMATLEDAVRAWALGASGLDADHVYFGRQTVRRSENAARIIINMGDLIPVGVPRLDHNYDAGRALGAEIEYEVKEPGHLVVELQAFAPQVVGSGTTASSLLQQCRSKLRLPQYRDALNAVGLGVLEQGTVQKLPAVVAGEWEDGAVLEVRFSYTLKTSDNTGYFATVQVELSVKPDGATVPVVVPIVIP